MVSVGLLIIRISIPGCASLKEKRSRLKSLLSRLRKEFNLSVAEVDYQDVWQSAVLACTLVSNDVRFTQRALQKITPWLEINWRDVLVVDEELILL